MAVRTLRFPAKLNSSTHRALNAFLTAQRHLWNAALEERIGAYQKCDKTISAYDQFKSLTVIRTDDPDYAKIAVAAQRSILFRLDKAFKAFFARVKRGEKPGFPRFRSIRRAVRSFETSSFRIHRHGAWHAVAIKGIGRFRFKGVIEGQPQLLRVVRTPRRVELHLVVERPVERICAEGDPQGIDVGIHYLVALSNGLRVAGRRLDRARLKRLQRTLSRKKPGSHNRYKCRRALAREWQRVREREHGERHELTAHLVREYGCRFFVEDLRIRNMLRNHSLARGISEQAWGEVVRLLTYKAEEAGGWVTKGPAPYTSQRCSACGTLPEGRLSQDERVFRCPSCSHEQDRDVNAARNILMAGLRADRPGGDIPACRKEAEQQGVRSATIGALGYGTEQYANARQGRPPEPVKDSI